MEQLEAVPVALILGGGMALGAYQAGVLAGLESSGRIHVAAVAGTAIGAVNGAVLAGNPAGQRAQRLREFWEHVTTDLAPAWFEAGGGTGALRRVRNIANVLGTYVGGARGLYQPRNFLRRGDTGPGLYDISQAAETLARFVDFDALNRSGVRFCALAMDVETARVVSFDTEAGDRIEPVHLLAACALMPSFAPLRVGERLLADAAPCANAPLEVFLSSARVGQVPPLCILIDLFAPDASPPLTLEAAAARAVELRHAGQTALRLEALERERSLEAALALPGAEPPDGAARSAAGTELIELCYRPPPHDAGAERVHDFSRATLTERWRRGQEDAEAVVSKTLELVPSAGAEAGLHLHRVGAWTQPRR